MIVEAARLDPEDHINKADIPSAPAPIRAMSTVRRRDRDENGDDEEDEADDEVGVGLGGVGLGLVDVEEDVA